MSKTAITLDSVWSSVQKLSAADRQMLAGRIHRSLAELKLEQKQRVAADLEALCGAWSQDLQSNNRQPA